MSNFSIAPAHTSQDLDDITHLFEAYAASLGIDLGFQDFANELASLPGAYSSPQGTLLLARNNNDEAIGCAALRPMKTSGHCEMKRLYVDPQGRGTGVGKALVEAVVIAARRMGYKAIRLDTLPPMKAARKLYKTMGFTEIEAYYDTPIEGMIFLELSLANDKTYPSP